MPPLDWLRTFEAAARLSNFTAAAGELGLTQAAVSQHVRSLEDRLKRPLFIRLARGVGLTPEGAAYMPHLQSAFTMIANTTRELFEPRAIQSVTIRLADTVPLPMFSAAARLSQVRRIGVRLWW